jgi:hypothetical protein
MVRLQEPPIWKNIPPDYHSQRVKEAIVDMFPKVATPEIAGRLRELRKEWFNDLKFHFETMEVIRYFIQDYPEITTIFINDLKIAISTVVSIENR